MRYIGSKVLLLDYINSVVDELAPEAKSMCDIFSGTASVSRYFKEKFEIISNDLLYFSYVLQKATIENNFIPNFEEVKSVLGINDVFSYLENEKYPDVEKIGFFYNNFSPNGGRMYITDDNALRIDSSRLFVEDWKRRKLLSENEYYYLIACIVEGIPFISNISGTYGAYHKTWDKRAHKSFKLFKLEVVDNMKNNKSYNEDGNNLVRKISGDILYIDPPYNERQYLPNYHLLETAALYDYPEVKGKTGVRPYQDKKSKFCMKKTVLSTFEDLVTNSNFKHVLLSYNSEGLMTSDQIESVMKKIGKEETFRIIEIPYRRFKSRSTNHDGEIHEFIYYIEKDLKK
jgi:adenine-specific DNA-methyltransferase